MSLAPLTRRRAALIAALFCAGGGCDRGSDESAATHAPADAPSTQPAETGALEAPGPPLVDPPNPRLITGSGLKDTKNAIRAAGRPIEISPDVSAVRDAMNAARKDAQAKGNNSA